MDIRSTSGTYYHFLCGNKCQPNAPEEETERGEGNKLPNRQKKIYNVTSRGRTLVQDYLRKD